MKTVQNYIEEAYEDCYTNQTQVPLTVGLRYFNDAIHDAEKRIAYVCRENFFYEKVVQNIVAGVNVYDLPMGNSDGSYDPMIPEFKNVTQIRVKYDNNMDYYRANPIAPTQNQKHTDILENNQLTSQPLFEIRKNKIYIFPMPKANVTDGLQIDFRATRPNYQLTDTEEDIPFPRQEHIVFLHKLRSYIFRGRAKYEEKALAEQDYELAMKQMLGRLVNVYNAPEAETLPPLSRLMY